MVTHSSTGRKDAFHFGHAMDFCLQVGRENKDSNSQMTLSQIPQRGTFSLPKLPNLVPPPLLPSRSFSRRQRDNLHNAKANAA